jgi:hypothetical protein
MILDELKERFQEDEQEAQAQEFVSHASEALAKADKRLGSPNHLFRWKGSGCGVDQIPVHAVRCKTLPFYSGYDLFVFDVNWPGMVLEYERKHVRDIRVLFLYHERRGGGNDVILIDGESSIIRNLNARPGMLQLTNENVFEYLKFFCACLWVEEGPFLVRLPSELKDGSAFWNEDNKVTDFEREFQEWEQEAFDPKKGLQKLQEGVKEAGTEERERLPDKDPIPIWIVDQQAWQIDDVCVQFGTKLYLAGFKVGLNGSVEMSDDTLFSKLPPLQPHRVVLLGEERPIKALGEREKRVPIRCRDGLLRKQAAERTGKKSPDKQQSEVNGIASLEQCWSDHGVLCLRGLYISDHVDLAWLATELDKYSQNWVYGLHSGRHAPRATREPQEEKTEERSGESRSDHLESTMTIKAVVIDDCLIGGAVLAEGLDCRGLFQISYSMIGGRLACQRIQCGQSLRLKHVVIRNCNRALGLQGHVPPKEWIHTAFDCSLAKIGEDVELEYVRIADDLILERAQVKGSFKFVTPQVREFGVKVELFCGVLGKMAGSRAYIGGDCTLRHVSASSVDFSSSVLGNIEIQRVWIDNSLTLTAAHVGRDCNIGLLYQTQRLEFEQIDIGGNCQLTNISAITMHLSFTTARRMLVYGVRIPTIDISSSRLGELQVTEALANSLSARTARIDGDCVIDSVIVAGLVADEDVVDFVRAEIGGFLSIGHGLERTHFGGGMDMSGIMVGGDLVLDGLKIDGILKIYTGTIGRLSLGIYSGSTGNESDKRRLMFPTETGGFEAISVTVNRSARFAGIQIQPSGKAQEEANGSLILKNCTVSEDVEFWSDRHWEHVLKHPELCLFVNSKRYQDFVHEVGSVAMKRRKFVASVYRDIKLTNLGAANLNLANLDVLGAIDLSGATIKSRLEAANDGLHTECTHLNLEQVRCGNGQFSALTVSRPGGVRHNDWRLGSVSAQNAHFDDTLSFCEDDEHVAHIAFRLDLTDCQAHHVRLAGENFDRKTFSEWFGSLSPDEQETEKSRPTAWLVLKGGEFHIASIIRRIPVLADFSGVEVKRWDLEKLPEKGQEHDPKALLPAIKDLLRFTYPFNRSTYLALEKFLRDEGRDSEASGVLWAMRTRVRRSSPVQEILDDTETTVPIWSKIMAFGRWLLALRFAPIIYPWPVLGLIVLWALLSGAIFRVPDNIIATDLHQSTNPVCAASGTTGGMANQDRSCHPPEWTLGQTFAMVFRYHVPPSDFVMQDEWEPSPNAPIFIAWRDCRWKLGVISPLTYAIFVASVHWIIVPLTIIGIFLRMRVKPE